MNKLTFLFFLNFLSAASITGQDTLALENAMTDAFNKGYEQLFISKDSSYFYFNSALESATELSAKEAQLDILTYWTYANGYYFDLENYRKNIVRTESILFRDSAELQIEDYEGYYDSFLLDKGNYYFKTREYEKAKAPFLELQTKFGSIPNNALSFDEASLLFSVYNFLATIYKHKGKYDLSEQYYERNRSLVRQNPGLADARESYLTNIDQLLSQLYILEGKHKEANELLSNAVEFYRKRYKKDKKFKNTLVTVYQNITENYILQDSLDRALYFLDQSQQYLEEQDPFSKKSLLLYGDIHSSISEDNIALDYYNKALKAYQGYRNNGPHQDLAEVQLKMAKFHLRRGQFEEGLREIQKALEVSGKQAALNFPGENPDPEQVFSRKQLLQLLDIKIQLLDIAYKSTKKSTYLKSALETVSLVVRTFELLRNEFDSKLDKQFLVESAYPVFHRILQLVYQAYEKTGNTALIEKAFEITERNKDILLLDAIRSANAVEFRNIPEEILESEAQYRSKISHVEKEIFENTTENRSASDSLVLLKQQYYSFLEDIAAKYPEYHALKYKNQKLNFQLVRDEILGDSKALLSFTATNDFLYAIILSADKESFIRLPFGPSERELIRNFYQAISKPALDKDKPFKLMAKELYKRILLEPMKEIDEEAILILPDGLLNYLPFDLLIDETDTYLLFSKSVSYNNSISSLLELGRKKTSDNKMLLAFAPEFHGSDLSQQNVTRDLGKLAYNTDEVSRVASFFESRVYQKKSATLENFMALAPEFEMIHLATHASANDEFPDYSYLAFSKTAGGSDVLHIKDLYNISLNAELVTLSACQTGIGELQKGEGMLSLSKGFFYAGAKSLANTLWKINDRSSAVLMGYFYEGLKSGLQKNEALRQAKIKYLEATEDPLLRHPYYWSAFVISGDITAVKATTYTWYIFGVVLLLLFLIYWFGYRANKSST